MAGEGVGQGWWPPWLLGDRDALTFRGDGRSHVCLDPAKSEGRMAGGRDREVLGFGLGLGPGETPEGFFLDSSE